MNTIKYFYAIAVQLRKFLVILLGIVVFGCGMLWGGGQEFSWAAPEQNPYFQTAPTRLPTPIPPPVATPTTSPPASEDNNKKDDESSSIQPSENVETPEQEGNQPDNKPSPTPTSQQESNTSQIEAPPTTPLPAQEGSQDIVADGLQQADLSLSKTVDNTAPKIGETITFTITIRNSGPDTATGVVLSDPLPVGLVLNSVLASQGRYNDGIGIWTVGTIFPDKSASLSIVAMVTKGGAVTNTAEIIAVNQLDPDSTPANSLPAEDDQDSVSITVFSKKSPVIQPDDTSSTVGANSTNPATVQTLSHQGEWLYWLYAFILGVAFLLIGFYLVNRA